MMTETQTTALEAKITNETRPANHSNTIAFCVDEHYLPYALFVAQQFIELHPEQPCDICICLPDLDRVPPHFLNQGIRFVEIAIEGIENLPVGKLSLAAYYRLFLPQIFQNDYHYIIYLDADVYIRRPFYSDIIKYSNSLPNNFCIAAAADIIEVKLHTMYNSMLKTIEDYIATYQAQQHIYRNSGVLVFQTKNFNIKNTLSSIFNHALSHSEGLLFHDQSALNQALLNQIAILPFTFNWQIDTLTYRLVNEFDPYLIHFIGQGKPWDTINRYTSAYQNKYQHFFEAYFPEHNFRLETEYDKRRMNPKYEHKIKEAISRSNLFLKHHILAKKPDLFSLYKKKKIRHALEKFPFSP